MFQISHKHCSLLDLETQYNSRNLLTNLSNPSSLFNSPLDKDAHAYLTFPFRLRKSTGPCFSLERSVTSLHNSNSYNQCSKSASSLNGRRPYFWTAVTLAVAIVGTIALKHNHSVCNHTVTISRKNSSQLLECDITITLNY